MNRLVIVLLIFALNVSLFAQWDVLNQGLDGFPEDSEFIGSSGWLAAHTTLLKSDDGGVSWYKLPWREDRDLTRIDFISQQMGWALAYSSTLSSHIILFSNDGGESWAVKHQLDNAYARDIYAMNEDTVFVLGGNYILRTTDAFKSYTKKYLETGLAELYVIDFYDTNHGTAIGGTYGQDNYSIFWRTDDGGESWQEITDRSLRNIYTMRFAEDSTAFFTAQDDSGRTLFCKTDDFFDSWQVQSMDVAYAQYVLHPLSADTVYSVTSRFDVTQQLTIDISYDAGKSWNTLKELPFWGVKHISFNRDVGYVTGTVGGGGFISQPYGPLVMRTTDRGQSWQTKLFSYPFRDVQFLDDNRGFASGGSVDIHHQAGELFKTTNGGKNWEVVQSAGTEVPKIQFVNEQTGYYLVGSRGQLFKTSDGGDSWFKVYENNYDSTGISLMLYDFQFIDANRGWLVGEMYEQSGFACILKTENGGADWEFEIKIADKTFKDIFLLDAQNGWATGSQGLIARYQNGEWKNMPVFSDKILNNVFFSDHNHGWISSGFDSFWYFEKGMYKTTNGGDSWDAIEGFDYIINDIFFADNNSGWLVGADTSFKGVILYTTDGGEHLDILAEDLPAALYSITFNENYGWVVGDKGLVLRTEDGVNWIEEPRPGISEDFKLYPNYPNPFNAKTIIEYSVGAYRNTPVQVELSIYNLLGQKVATLVDKKMPAGSHSVQWDATGMASGIYIYSLQTKTGLKETRKLLLLK